ncbi:hypothetical protein [Neisseria sp.]
MKPFFCKTAIALSLTLPVAANAAEYVCNVEGITVYASYQINNTCRVTDSYNLVETNVSQTNAEQLNLNSTLTEQQTDPKAENSSASSDKTNISTGSTTEIFALTDSVKPTEPIPATATPTKPTKTPLSKAYRPTTDALFSDKDVDNDIKILPNGPIGGVTNTAEAANPRLNILLRNSIQKRQAKQNSQQYIHRKAPVRTIPATIAAPQPKPKETRKQVLQGEIRNEQTAIIRLQTQLNAAKQKGDQIKIQQLTRTINARKANIRAIQGEMSR